MKYTLILSLVFANSMAQIWKDYQWESDEQDVQRPYKTSVSEIDDLQSLDSYKDTSTSLESNSQHQDTELQELNQSRNQEVNQFSENTNDDFQNVIPEGGDQISVLYKNPEVYAPAQPGPVLQKDESNISDDIDSDQIQSAETSKEVVQGNGQAGNLQDSDSDISEPKYAIYDDPIQPYVPEQVEDEVKFTSNKRTFSTDGRKSRQNRGVVYRPLFQYRQEQARKQKLQANRAKPAPHYQPQHYPRQYRRTIRGVVYRPLFQYKEEEARKERLRTGKSHQKAHSQQPTQQYYPE